MADSELVAGTARPATGLLRVLQIVRRLAAWAPLDPLLGLLSLGTLAWLNAETLRIGDMIAFFMPLMFYASLVALIAALSEPRRLRILVALGLTLANGWPLLAPAPQAAATANGPELTVATSNVLASRYDYASLVNWSTGSGIDVLGQQEVNASELAKFAAIRSHFPSTPADSLLGRNPEVTAWTGWQILTATRVGGTGPAPFGVWGGQALRLALAPPGATASARPAVIVYVVHPASPHTEVQWDFRNIYLEALGKAIAAEPRGLPIICMGDFNTPVWSPFFKRFVAETGLVDASGTHWPATTRFFRELDAPTFFGAPVDHILVSPSIEVKRFEVGPDIGSDHLPLIANLRLPKVVG
jgi:endonuclease/exonuclease/phosphatase (EEP) superfamily protein YafD